MLLKCFLSPTQTKRPITTFCPELENEKISHLYVHASVVKHLWLHLSFHSPEQSDQITSCFTSNLSLSLVLSIHPHHFPFPSSALVSSGLFLTSFFFFFHSSFSESAFQSKSVKSILNVFFRSAEIEELRGFLQCRQTDFFYIPTSTFYFGGENVFLFSLCTLITEKVILRLEVAIPTHFIIIIKSGYILKLICIW